MGTFTYAKKNFLRNGEKHMVYAGAIHYFRIMPESWRDRLMKLKNVGFNTVETYVCWSLHEREEGKFDFSGRLDLGRFIDEASELGLDVIIRPGPYICAEVDFGGMPSWLLKYPGIELRCDNEIFLEKVERYLEELSKIIKPRFIGNGGRITMLQIENEYGSYGNDDAYKAKLLESYKRLGFDECLIFTADGNEVQMLENGRFPGIMQGLTFGSKPKQVLEERLVKGEQPDICVEYWNGWFDVYGENHHTRDAEDVCRETGEFVENEFSFNFYMFCGGTNYDMINGANYFDGSYRYQTTSYDYSAPVTEAGDMTEKYYLLKALMERLTGVKSDLPVQNSKKCAYAPVQADGFADLFEYLPEGELSSHPKTLEALGVDFGYALYSTRISALEAGDLYLRRLRDRATVLVNGKIVASVNHYDKDGGKIPLPKSEEKLQLDILVENRGRCNYGYQLKDPKGILDGILYRSRMVNAVTSYPVKAELPKGIVYREIREGDESKLGYYHFHLRIDGEPCDTFLYPDGMKNGCIFVNGANIGRYCNHQPPQRTLYVPAELLKEGDNDIVLFETDGTTTPRISFSETPIYAEVEAK